MGFQGGQEKLELLERLAGKPSATSDWKSSVHGGVKNGKSCMNGWFSIVWLPESFCWRLWLWLGRFIHISHHIYRIIWWNNWGLSWVIPNAKPQTRQFWITKKDKTDLWMESTHLMFWGWGSIQLELLLILQAMELQNHLNFGMFAGWIGKDMRGTLSNKNHDIDVSVSVGHHISTSFGYIPGFVLDIPLRTREQ